MIIQRWILFEMKKCIQVNDNVVFFLFIANVLYREYYFYNNLL